MAAAAAWAALALLGGGPAGAEGLLHLPASGDCYEGYLPPSCEEGNLSHINWVGYLAMLCSPMVDREVAASLTLEALFHFDRESAVGCLSGFAVTLQGLYGSGALEWEHQAIRFYPDGRVRVLIHTWDMRPTDPVLKTWSTTLPGSHSPRPPFPPWVWPGVLRPIREAQDLTQMPSLPRSSRCNPQALQHAGCVEPVWLNLLERLCGSCETSGLYHGLPCLYDQDMLQLVAAVLEPYTDRFLKPTCPHGLLAAILALHGRSSLVQPEVSEFEFLVPRREGPPVIVLHTLFRQVLENPTNYFPFNVPMLDLAPFPLHTGMLRSARLNVDKDPHYYLAFLGLVSTCLSGAGVQHVLMPGDASMASSPTRADSKLRNLTSSFFVKYEAQEATGLAVEQLLQALHSELGGAWRRVHVSVGLWQVGEEPYRFSPHQGIPYRTFCPECVSVSVYFYLPDGLDHLVPLGTWVPCLVPWRRVFPVRHEDVGGASVPAAADPTWLQRAQRGPTVWIPGEEADSKQSEKSCRRVRRRLIETLDGTGAGAAGGRSLASAVAVPQIAPAFDLSDGVLYDLGLYDLMRHREDSEEEGLRRFSDKILFKQRLLEEGIPLPQIYYMSNDSPDVMDILKTMPTTRFVAKPTHLAATSFVYVMRDGVNLVNGKNTSIEEVAQGLQSAWQDKHVDDWATESTPPGVIVEELIEAPVRNGVQGSTPDEFKCQTFFGQLLFCEWVFVQNMTSGQEGRERFADAFMSGDRAQPAKGHEMYGIPNFISKGYVFRDGSCIDCSEPIPLSEASWAKLIYIVERAAAGTDHIRIDVFVTPSGEPVVNEANISFLKISKFPAPLVEEMRRRWLEGYWALHC